MRPTLAPDGSQKGNNTLEWKTTYTYAESQNLRAPYEEDFDYLMQAHTRSPSG